MNCFEISTQQLETKYISLAKMFLSHNTYILGICKKKNKKNIEKQGRAEGTLGLQSNFVARLNR